MNILLISLDTCCSNHLSCYGHKYQTSPHVDTLASQGVLFERCYASDVPTPPSYTSMLSGRYGIHNGIFGFQAPDTYRAGAPMLQQVLVKAGYNTCALSNLFYVCPWLMQGWQEMVPPGLRFQGGPAPEVTDKALTYLKRQGDTPFFLFAHYWDPHQPYNKAPEEHRKLFPTEQYEPDAPSLDKINANPMMKGFYERYHEVGEGDASLSPAEVLARYDSQIHFVDEHVGRLLNGLEELGMAEDTLVVLTSDHGEAFGEYGWFDHFTSYENIAHVPLIMRLPGTLEADTRIEGLVYGTDIYSTVLELAGVEEPDGIDAKSLAPAMSTGGETPHDCVVTSNNALVAQRMLVQGTYGLVHTINRGPYAGLKPWELFDVTGDPEKELSADNPETVAALKSRLEEWLEAMLNGAHDPLINAARDGGWTMGHGAFVWGVLKNLDFARKDPVFWGTFTRSNGSRGGLMRALKLLQQ